MEKLDELYTSGTIVWNGEPRQYLRVKSTEDAILTGTYVQKIEEYPDMTVTREYRILDIIRQEKAGDFFYKWYLVEDTSRNVDRTPAVVKRVDTMEAQQADADAMAVDLEYRMVLVELGLNDQ